MISLFNFLNVLFLSRYLNIQDFGNYSGMFIVFIIFTSIQHALFIAPIYTLEVDIHDKKVLQRINETRSIYFISIIFLFLIFLIFSDFIIDIISIEINNLGFSLMLIFFLINDYNRRILIKLEEFHKTILYDFIIYPIFFLTILLFELSGNLSLYNIIFSYCFLSLLSSVFLIYKIGLPLKLILLNRKILNNYWNFSKWIIYSAISQFIAGNLYIIVASNILGASVYGIIRVFQSISGVFNVFLQYIDTQTSIDLPIVFSKKGSVASFKYTFRIILITVLVLLPVYIVTFLFGFDRVITLLFGDKYISYSYFLNFTFILVILNLINNLIKQLFRVFNHTSKILYSSLFSSITALFAINYIINFFGLGGVFIGTMFAQIIVIIVSIYFLMPLLIHNKKI